MRAAIYARVSTSRQARDQSIDQQVEKLEAHTERKGWTLEEEECVYLDEGYSGASLNRPALDALRDAAAMAEFDVLLVAAPDRLARKYVHQVLLIEELQGRGCRVEFVERPMSQDPNDQLLLQIRGAEAEYERTLIAERMRRGRLAKLKAGQSFYSGCGCLSATAPIPRGRATRAAFGSRSTRRPSSGRCSHGTWSGKPPSEA